MSGKVSYSVKQAGRGRINITKKRTKERIRLVMGKEDYLRFICYWDKGFNLCWVPPVPPEIQVRKGNAEMGEGESI